MLGQDGRVVSGTMSNIFLQRGADLTTPAIDGAGIAGVVRNLAIEVGMHSGHRVRVAAVSVDELLAADALFLSNSLIGVVPVQRFETVDYDPDIKAHAVIAETRHLCHQGGQPGGSADE